MILSNNLKIKLTDILAFFMYFWIIKIERFETPIFTLFKYTILLFETLYILKNINYLKGNIKELLLVLSLGGCLIYSSMISDVEGFYKRWSFFHAYMIFVLFSMFFIYGAKQKISSFIRAGIVFLTIFLTINDLLAILFPSEFYGIYESNDGWVIGTFLLGNKFNVAYDHFIFLILVVINEKEKKIRNYKMLVCTLLISLICLYVQCKTMMLGCFFMLCLYFMPSFIKEILQKPVFIIAGTILSAIFVIGYTYILYLPIVQDVVTKVLHRDLTLTGRTEVYRYIFEILELNPLWGNGYGNTIYKTITIWYANAQNGFWDYAINYGLVSACLFIIIAICACVKTNSLTCKRYDDDFWICIAAVYTYLFVGMVEITFSIQFLFLIAFIFGLYNSKKDYRTFFDLPRRKE